MGFQIKRMTQRVDREKMRDLFCQIENEKPWDRNNISIQVINPPSPKKSSFFNYIWWESTPGASVKLAQAGLGFPKLSSNLFGFYPAIH